MRRALERVFHLKAQGTTPGRELLAGVTTFLVMAYIIFVNPTILTLTGVAEGKGPDFLATVTATCLVAGIMSILMGCYTNYPLAIAPGMGLNAVVAYQLVVDLGLPWPAAMGVITLEGAVVGLLVLTGFREAAMAIVPLSLKRAIGVGIGLFILFIGLVSGGLVKPGKGVPLTLGDLDTFPVLVALTSLSITLILLAWRVQGALLWGMLVATAIAVLMNLWQGSTVFPPVVAVIPERWLAFPDFSTLGKGLDFRVFTYLGALSATMLIFSIMLADFFDTMGTVIGIGGEAGWFDEKGRLPRLNRILLVDSLGAFFGGICSSSSATTYIESAAGVSVGGRTGLTAVTTGCCFLLAIFFAPVARVVPPQATAAALIVVGFLMCRVVREIPFSDLEEGFPALMTMTVMPFTYSITNGIGAGILTYVFLKTLTGKRREVHGLLYVIAAAFLLYFLFPVGQGES